MTNLFLSRDNFFLSHDKLFLVMTKFLLSRDKLIFKLTEGVWEQAHMEGLIRYYFFRGFEYVQILNFLVRYNEKVISERTLHRRQREYG